MKSKIFNILVFSLLFSYLTAYSQDDELDANEPEAVAEKRGPTAATSAKGDKLKLSELGESDKSTTPKLQSFLKKHKYIAPTETFLPEEGGIKFPFVKFNENYGLIQVFKLFDKDQADGYLVLLDISNTPIALDTIGPFFGLNITGIAFEDLLSDNESELVVNYEYDLVAGQTIYKKKGSKYMPFFQISKQFKPPRIIDLDGDGKFEIISSLELENTSKGAILLGDLNQYWNDIYTFQNGAFFKNNKRFKSFLEKNVIHYEAAIDSIKNSELILERVTFMESDPTSGYIKDLRIWITTIKAY